MKFIAESDVLFFKSIRILLLSIIIFMLSVGNTFSMVAYHIGANADRDAASEEDPGEERDTSEEATPAAMLAQADLAQEEEEEEVVAPTQEEIDAAIRKGLAWLATQQNQDGSWGSGNYTLGDTAAAVLAFEDEGHFPNAGTEYSGNVEDGLDYIFSKAVIEPSLPVQTAGDPDADGDGRGVYFKHYSYMYESGMCMMAIVASNTPDRVVTTGDCAGWTYSEVVRDAVDFSAYAQNESGSGRGGWRYGANYGNSDNSVAQWPVLGLIAAEQWGIYAPDWVKDELDIWVNYIQNANGGAGYTYPGGGDAPVNAAKTGALLVEHYWLGDSKRASERAQKAINYIDSRWESTPSEHSGNKGHPYTMFAVYKGLALMGVDNLSNARLDGDWWGDYCRYLVDNQIAVGSDQGYWKRHDGAWNVYDTYLTTGWYITILQATIFPVEVAIDLPDCACDYAGYDVNVEYSVQRFQASGKLEVYKDGNLVERVNLVDFQGSDTRSYTVDLDTPGEHTWEALLDMTITTGKGTGVTAQSRDKTSLDVWHVEVSDIPDVTIPRRGVPFTAFNLDDYLICSGDLPVTAVTWSATAPTGWTVDIDENSLVTVTTPPDASESVTVTFTADATCCSDVICSGSDDVILTPNLPPVADTGGPYASRAFMDLTFDGSGSLDPEGNELTYLWDFGGGITATGVNPTRVYNTPGMYTATLTVNDSFLDSEPVTTVIAVSIKTIQVDLGEGWNFISLPMKPIDNTLSSVLESVEGLYNSVWRYNAFSNGNAGGWEAYVVDVSGSPDDSVTTESIDDLNTMDSGWGYWIDMKYAATLVVRVRGIPGDPVPLKKGWNMVGYNSLVAQPREDALLPIDGMYDSIWTHDNATDEWSFHIVGWLCPDAWDLNNLDQLNPWKGYWIDSLVDTPDDLMWHDIIPNDAPVADAGPQHQLDMGDAVTLEGIMLDASASQDPNEGTGDRIVSYSWDLNADGVFGDMTGVNVTLAPEELASFGINTPGTFLAVLEVEDTFSAADLDATSIQVFENVPVAVARVTPDIAVAPGDVLTFDHSASWHNSFGHNITFYEWDFDNDDVFDYSTTDVSETPQHTYPFIPGVPSRTETAVLRVTDDNSPARTDTDIVDVPVVFTNRVPVADADGPYPVILGEGVTLDGSGSSDEDIPAGDSVVSYEWDLSNDGTFGDVTGVNPALTADELASFGIDAAGSYPVALQVKDTFGAVGEDATTLELMGIAVAKATVTPSQIHRSNRPFTLVTLDASESEGDFLEYDWDIPDATFITGSRASMVAEVSLPGTEEEYSWVLTVSNLASQDQASGAITVVNDPPVANAGVDRSVKIRDVVILDGSGSSDPNEEPITYQWSFISMPQGSAAVLDDPTSATPGFTADRAGEYMAQLTVSDGELNSAPDTVVITVTNDPPLANAGKDVSVKPGTQVTLNGSGSFDPNGAPITYNWGFVSIPKDSDAVLDDPTSVAPSFTTDMEGKYIAQLIVNDGFLDSAPDTVTILAEEDHIRPVVDVTVDPLIANLGDEVTITVDATDNTGVIVSKTLTVNGAAVALDASGKAIYTSSVAGVFTAAGTAKDENGNEGYDSEEFRFRGADDGTDPIVDITSPADNSKVSTSTDIIGTASDDNLVLYKLEYSVKNKNEFITFASGTSSVTNGVLGRLDPTTMENGLYDIRLTAEDAGGRSSFVTRTYQLEGQMKIGYFTLRFQDINIPVAGIPITVIRTYDSRNKRKGDFGVGWTLEVSDIEISESTELAKGWQLASVGGLIPYCQIQPVGPHYITLTYPNGRTDEFYMSFSPDNWAFCPALKEATVSFNAAPGTYSSLTALGDNTVLVMGSSGGSATLQDYDFRLYDPDRYRLTTVDGTVFTISEDTGLESIRDSDGNIIAFGPNGITHSAGKSIMFTRDAQGRIITAADPIGYTVQYEYDYYGDLVRVTDQEGNVTRFIYDSNHYLLDIIDPVGNRCARNEYDADGRLIRQTDADGNLVQYDHDIDGRQEIVRDRLGNPTTYRYDDQGNVTQVIDALGNVTSYTYNANGNKLTETDPLGNTSTYTYDAGNNMLTSADPLGNTTSYTYDARGQVLTITDPLGNTTTNTYNTNGKLLTATDSRGNTTSYSYDASGNLLSTVDSKGNATASEYNSVGYLSRQIDSEGNVATFAYDANGNPLTQTTTRTDAQGNTVTMTNTNVFDGMGRLTQTTDSDGNIITVEYNAIGKKSAMVDKDGNRTTYEYDSRGNLVKTNYPDGTAETVEYDVNGNKLSSTDREGRTTRYEYDELNRQTAIVYPDGRRTGTQYDAAGNAVSQTDRNGNTVAYEYDAAGRRTKVIDPLGNGTTFAYDAGGRSIGMTDANGNAVSYEYNESNQRTKMTFADGTFLAGEYDEEGRMISETDPAGNVTRYEYDSLGRLTKIIDANGGEITLTYDESGHRTSITDANGRTTKWGYDNQGKVISHTLSSGVSETFTYGPGGQLLTTTDFDAQAITYGYDDGSNLATRTYPDGTQIKYTYTDAGGLKTVTDAKGVTSYGYGAGNNLVEVVNPDGTKLTYTYDDAGNRTAVTAPSGTTTYTYDALGRLTTVTDPDGGVTTHTYDGVGNRTSMTYPNGTVTEYTYNSLNRLTQSETRESTGDVISRYTYTLGLLGNRTRVVEFSGRTIDYTYDSLYRLIGEEITDPVLGNETISYTYDAVGNRLTKTDSSGTIRYTYDANDRLTKEEGPNYTYTYTYGNNGNMLSKSDGTTVTNYAYDYENRLISVQTGANQTTYQYDAGGIRVRAETNGAVTNYLVDKNRPYAQVLEERDAGGSLIASYIYGDDLISQNRGGISSYYHYDGNSNTRTLTDGMGAATDTYTYDAFGDLIASTGAIPNNYLFAGEQYDPNVGFYYLRARYYNSQTGHFVTADPLDGSVYDPRSLHKYVYAYNNPVNNLDPSGMQTLTGTIVTVAIIGTLAAMALPMLSTTMRGVYAWLSDYFPDAFLVGLVVTLPVGHLLNLIGGAGISASESIFSAAAGLPPQVIELLAVPLTGTLLLSMLKLAPKSFIVPVGIEALMIVSSAQLATYWYWGGGLSFPPGKSITGTLSFTAYAGLVYNLWNADDYAGWFLSFSGSAGKWGGGVFWDPTRWIMGPYGISVNLVTVSGSTAKGSGAGALVWYEMIGRPIEYDSMWPVATMAAVGTTAVAAYYGSRIGGGAGAGWGALGGAIYGALWGIMKWSYNEELREAHNITLRDRQTIKRKNLKDAKGFEYQSGPFSYILALFGL